MSVPRNSVPRFIVTLAVLGLSGCAMQTELKPTPSSLLSRSTAVEMALNVIRDRSKYCLINIAPTGSMRPVIDNHSVVIVERYDGQDLAPGDIVVFDHMGKYIIHRIEVISKDSILTLGDNNKVCDGWVTKKDIKYRLIAIIYTNKAYSDHAQAD